MPTPRADVPLRAAPRETTAKAIAILDAQFSWLRGAEKRLSWNQASTSVSDSTASLHIEMIL